MKASLEVRESYCRLEDISELKSGVETGRVWTRYGELGEGCRCLAMVNGRGGFRTLIDGGRVCLRIAVAVPVVAMGLDSMFVWNQSKSAFSNCLGQSPFGIDNDMQL